MNLDAKQFAEARKLLSSREWRLNNLYHIVVKSGKLLRFKMNWAQLIFHAGIWHYNNILKARQLGMSTYVAILILDACLFEPNTHAGIVDRTAPDAKKKLKKIKLAFDKLDYLPAEPTQLDRELAAIGAAIKEAHKNSRIGVEEAHFVNGSNIYAGASLRGSTHQILHISELGYVARHNPSKAQETITGSFNTIDHKCVIILESTHEGGAYGLNYRLVTKAMDLVGKKLTPLDPKFFFFSWHKQSEYRIVGATFDALDYQEDGQKLLDYFKELAENHDIHLDDEQKVWYASKMRTLGTKMRQEYPTLPDEALNPLADGAIYGAQINYLRELGRLTAEFEVMEHYPIYATFDKGISDATSIWWVQMRPDGLFGFLDYYSANGQGLQHFIDVLRDRDARYGRIAAVALPHDAAQRDYTGTRYIDKIEAAGYSTILVRRTSDLWGSVDNTRAMLRHSLIHARCSEMIMPPNGSEECPSGVDALSNYSRQPEGKSGAIRDAPVHDAYSHACDSLRTFADAQKMGLIARQDSWKSSPSMKSRNGLAKGVEW